MARIKVDLSTAVEAIPVGVYKLSVTDVELVEPAEEFDATGKQKFPYLKYNFTVAEGKFREFKVTGMYTLNPKASFILKPFLIVMGEQIDPYQTTFDFDPVLHIGKAFMAFLDVEPYNDRLQNVIKAYNPTQDYADQLMAKSAESATGTAAEQTQGAKRRKTE